jgi:outer membrane lipoprotein SlyB
LTVKGSAPSSVKKILNFSGLRARFEQIRPKKFHHIRINLCLKEIQMQPTKLVSVMIMAAVMTSAGHAGAQVIDETRTGYVTAVETIWTQRVTHQPTTTTSCHMTRSHSDAQGNLGEIVIGGLVGSAIGNKLSDNHGAGSLGALFGAVAAMDHAPRQRRVCRDQTSWRQTSESVADHYVVHVRTDGRDLTFRSHRPYRVNQRVSLSVSSNYGLLR